MASQRRRAEFIDPSKDKFESRLHEAALRHALCIASSGFVAVLDAVRIGATWIFGASASPGLIVATDTTFHGLSIVAFGRLLGDLR